MCFGTKGKYSLELNLSNSKLAAAIAIKQLDIRMNEKNTVPTADGILMPKKTKTLNSTTIKMGSSTYN